MKIATKDHDAAFHFADCTIINVSNAFRSKFTLPSIMSKSIAISCLSTSFSPKIATAIRIY